MQSGKLVLWALDANPTPYMVERLSKELGCEVTVVGVGRITRAEELLEAMHDTGADIAVIDMDSVGEIEKLLEKGIDLIVPLFDEVRECPVGEECRWDPLLELVVEEEGGARVLRFTGYGRVRDVLVQVEDLDGHVHGEEH